MHNHNATRQGDAHCTLSLRQYGASHGSHSHDHFQILLGLHGALDLEVEGRGLRVAPGRGCVIAPGDRHDFESAQGSLCLVLDSREAAWARCIPRSAPPGHALALGHYLAGALQQGQPLARAQGPALLLEAWLSDAQVAPSALPGSSPRRRIDWPALQRWAAERWHEEITVADLAAQVHLSTSQFAARCQSEWGLGAIAWLRGLRLEHAQQLRGSGLPVAEVARRTGYRSPSALTAALRRQNSSRH